MQTIGTFTRSLALAGALSAGSGAAQLRIDGAPSSLLALLDAARVRLPAAEPHTGHDLARVLQGLLRLGDERTARTLLQGFERATREPIDTDLAWLCAAHLWFERTTGDRSLAVPVWRRRAAHLLAAAPDAHAPFCEQAMQVHARLCWAELGGPDDAADATTLRQRAIAQLLELERQTWQPGRQHFRTLPSAGAIALPSPADDSLLVPASAGMLVASGDRLLRHLGATLTALHATDPVDARPSRVASVAPAALRLAAATQLDDSPLREHYFRQLTTSPIAADPAECGLQLDSACQALSGLRVAVGAGVDPVWLRLAPWLPDGCASTTVDGMLARGCALRLELNRVPSSDGTLLDVTVHRTDRGRPLALPIVVASGAQQWLALLAADESFRCSWPIR